MDESLNSTLNNILGTEVLPQIPFRHQRIRLETIMKLNPAYLQELENRNREENLTQYERLVFLVHPLFPLSHINMNGNYLQDFVTYLQKLEKLFHTKQDIGIVLVEEAYTFKKFTGIWLDQKKVDDVIISSDARGYFAYNYTNVLQQIEPDQEIYVAGTYDERCVSHTIESLGFVFGWENIKGIWDLVLKNPLDIEKHGPEKTFMRREQGKKIEGVYLHELLNLEATPEYHP